MKLHTGDTVVVTRGKDKGKTGTVMRVQPDTHQVVVSGVNIRTKHVKKTFQEAGKKLHFEASISVANVMLIDPKTKKRSRIGYAIIDGKKKRISKVSGEAVVAVRAAKKAVAKKEGAPAEKKEQKVENGSEAQGSDKQQPFWKRMKFGSQAMQDGDMKEGSHMHQDHSIPSQNIPNKTAGRGS
jgi:large subunit ribosomal protein L24